MFVYLDNWSLIPILIIWIINLTIFGVSTRAETRKVHPSPPFQYKPGSLPINRSQKNQEDNEPTQTKSIFLNSTMAIFFPSCHIHLPPTQNLVEDQKNLHEKTENILLYDLSEDFQLVVSRPLYPLLLTNYKGYFL